MANYTVALEEEDWPGGRVGGKADGLRGLIEEGFAGATVLKGAMGFGVSSIKHSDRLLRLSQDLPVVIEVVECQKKIDETLPRIEQMFQGGLITLEKARVIRFGERKDA